MARGESRHPVRTYRPRSGSVADSALGRRATPFVGGLLAGVVASLLAAALAARHRNRLAVDPGLLLLALALVLLARSLRLLLAHLEHPERTLVRAEHQEADAMTADLRLAATDQTTILHHHGDDVGDAGRTDRGVVNDAAVDDAPLVHRRHEVDEAIELELPVEVGEQLECDLCAEARGVELVLDTSLVTREDSARLGLLGGTPVSRTAVHHLLGGDGRGRGDGVSCHGSQSL